MVTSARGSQVEVHHGLKVGQPIDSCKVVLEARMGLAHMGYEDADKAVLGLIR